MDEKYSEAVKTAFLHYHKKGWVYQGERVINWCPRCQTSLSDLEIEHNEQKGKLYFIKYPDKKRRELHNSSHNAPRNNARRHGRGGKSQ